MYRFGLTTRLRGLKIRLTTSFAAAMTVCGLLAAAFPANASTLQTFGFLDTGGVFTTIDVPGSNYTSAMGINDAGQIVGVFFDSTGDHGFLDTGGVFTTINVPGTTRQYTRRRH